MSPNKQCFTVLSMAAMLSSISLDTQAASVSILGGTVNTGTTTTLSTTQYTPATTSHFPQGWVVNSHWQENGFFTDWSTTPTTTVLAWTIDSPASYVPGNVGYGTYGLGAATVNFYVVDITGYTATSTSFAADKAKIESGALFASFSGDFSHANVFCQSAPLFNHCGSQPGTLHLTGGAAAPYLPTAASFSFGTHVDNTTLERTEFGTFTANFVGVAAVPEPTSQTLLLAGLLVAGIYVRKRQAIS